jgi:BirA family transcriptional regulator, biotin operon repressor / biotin---[acetyl-CoA-carboxylase] ligase
MGDPAATWRTGTDGGRFTVHHFASVDSTNRWVLDEARAGAAEGLVAVADHQAAGRGRRGRTWEAAPGSSLLVSVLLRPGSWHPPLGADRVHLLTMAAGLALADAVQVAAGVEAALKWPNDLVVGERKLAGLLAEADVSGTHEVRAVVLGAGCNVAQREFPPELTGLATSCALEAGRDVPRDDVLDAYLDRLAARLDALDDVALAYRDRLATLGRSVRVDLGDRVVEGTAVGIDDGGRLELEHADGARTTVAVGDVVHLRPA